MDRREYRRTVRLQAWSDAKAVHTHVYLAWVIGPLLAGAVVGFARERAMGVALSSSFSGWLMPLLDVAVALVLWLIAVAIYFCLKGARDLYLASLEELSASNAALAEARAARETDAARHPNLTVEFLEDRSFVLLKISNTGGLAEKLDIRVD